MPVSLQSRIEVSPLYAICRLLALVVPSDALVVAAHPLAEIFPTKVLASLSMILLSWCCYLPSRSAVVELLFYDGSTGSVMR